MSEKLNVEWKEHQSAWRRSLLEIRSKDDFADVTLVTDDKIRFSAHKIILSSCSNMGLWKYVLLDYILSPKCPCYFSKMEIFQLSRTRKNICWIGRNKLYQIKEEEETIQKMQRCYIKVKKNLLKSQIKPSKILVKTKRKVHNSYVIFDVVLNIIQTLRVGSTKETLDLISSNILNLNWQTDQVLEVFLLSRMCSWWGRSGTGER